MIEDTREPPETKGDACSECWGNGRKLLYDPHNQHGGSREYECDHCHGTGIEPTGRFYDRERKDSCLKD